MSTQDRFACIQYKEEPDKILCTEASEVVIGSFANDEFDFKQKWEMDNDKLHKVIKKFPNAESPLKFLIFPTNTKKRVHVMFSIMPVPVPA